MLNTLSYSLASKQRFCHSFTQMSKRKIQAFFLKHVYRTQQVNENGWLFQALNELSVWHHFIRTWKKESRWCRSSYEAAWVARRHQHSLAVAHSGPGSERPKAPPLRVWGLARLPLFGADSAARSDCKGTQIFGSVCTVVWLRQSLHGERPCMKCLQWNC